MNLENIVKKAKRPLMHPNKITALGAACCIGGVALLASNSTDIYGGGLIVIGNILDATDGHVARKYNMKTKEGAKLDPFADKIKNVMIGGYIIGCEATRGSTLLPVAVGTSFIVDYISQKQRGNISEQAFEAYNAVVYSEQCKKDVEENSFIRANYWGKTKTFLQMGVGLTYIAKGIFENHINSLNEQTNDNIAYVLSAALITSAVLGGIGIYKRMQNKLLS